MVGLRSSPDHVTAIFEPADGGDSFTHRSQYLIGADDGRSATRKLVGIPFEGWSWDDYTIITAKVIYDTRKMAPFGEANFTVDPELWGVVIKLPEHNWRINFAISSKEGGSGDWTGGMLMKRAREVIPRIIPDPVEDFEITRVAAYEMHQLCAAKFVEGRVILAGDSAHVSTMPCTPSSAATPPCRFRVICAIAAAKYSIDA